MKTLVCSLGVLALTLLGTSANAQTFLLNPTSGGTGLGTWSVTLGGDGGTGAWTVSVTANGATPNSDVSSIGIRFLNASQVTITPSSATGGISGSGWGFASPNTFSNANPFTTGAATNLKKNGSNTFTASINLPSYIGTPANKPLYVSIIASGTTAGGWSSGVKTLAPEAGAVAQFLPALLPVGLVLGRRRFLRKKAA